MVMDMRRALQISAGLVIQNEEAKLLSGII